MASFQGWHSFSLLFHHGSFPFSGGFPWAFGWLPEKKKIRIPGFRMGTWQEPLESFFSTVGKVNRALGPTPLDSTHPILQAWTLEFPLAQSPFRDLSIKGDHLFGRTLLKNHQGKTKRSKAPALNN